MTIGYRVGEPQFTNAKKVIEFEVVDSGNEPMLDDLAAALHCEPTLDSINKALDAQFGSDAIAIWLTDTPNLAEKHYGPGEAYKVKIPPGAIVGVDLGEDGKLWIWGLSCLPMVKNNPTVFVEIRMLKDAPPITGSDMKTYGPFREGRVYAIPKANARVFIKHGIAKATRKEAGKPTLKEMFKGEVLTPYVEAAKVKALVETDEEKVIAQIVENAKYWASNICKRVTLEKYCIEKKGVKNPSEILDNLIRRGIAYTPRKGYIGLTEPEKYGLPPIEEVKLNTGKLADVFLELLKKAGVSLPSRFKGKFEEALDIKKSYEENVKLIEAAAQRIILLEKTERVLGEIREARSE